MNDRYYIAYKSGIWYVVEKSGYHQDCKSLEHAQEELRRLQEAFNQLLVRFDIKWIHEKGWCSYDRNTQVGMIFDSEDKAIYWSKNVMWGEERMKRYGRPTFSIHPPGKVTNGEFIMEVYKLFKEVKEKFPDGDPMADLKYDGRNLTLEAATVDALSGTCLKLEEVGDGLWYVVDSGSGSKYGFNHRGGGPCDEDIWTSESLLDEVKLWHEAWMEEQDE